MLEHLSAEEWDDHAILKANQFICTNRAKQTQAQDDEIELHYGIAKDTPLSIQNILQL